MFTVSEPVKLASTVTIIAVTGILNSVEMFCNVSLFFEQERDI
jgi:hypothetical protein